MPDHEEIAADFHRIVGERLRRMPDANLVMNDQPRGVDPLGGVLLNFAVDLLGRGLLVLPRSTPKTGQ